MRSDSQRIVLWFLENRAQIKIFNACLFKGSQEQSFFPSDTLIYGIARNGSKNFNIRNCEHMILGQLRIRARPTKNAPLILVFVFDSDDFEDDYDLG